MNPPCDFEYLEGYACFRPSSHGSFEDAVNVISQAISEAHDKGIKRLVVDSTNLTGFPPPTIWERYFMAEAWAAKARGLRLAVVAHPELIDPFRFGVLVARNRGLFADVFTSESQAVSWILNPKPE